MRSLRDPGLWLIAVTTLCGLADVPGWFVIPASTIGMQALTLPRYLALWERACAAGAQGRWWTTLGLSVGLAAMIAGAAFAVGRAIGMWIGAI